MRDDDMHRYDDIINMPHHISDTHPQMSLYNRAAQFSPFAALTGYEDVINDTMLEDIASKETVEIYDELTNIPDDSDFWGEERMLFESE